MNCKKEKKEKSESQDPRLEILEMILNLREKLRSSMENEGNQDDEGDEEEENCQCHCKDSKEDAISNITDQMHVELQLAESQKKEYFKMMSWAFDLNEDDEDKVCNKSDMVALWAKLHPNLPPIYISKCVDNTSATIALVMQIAPYWYIHKNEI